MGQTTLSTRYWLTEEYALSQCILFKKETRLAIYIEPREADWETVLIGPNRRSVLLTVIERRGNYEKIFNLGVIFFVSAALASRKWSGNKCELYCHSSKFW